MRYDEIRNVKKVVLRDGREGTVISYEADFSLGFGGFQGHSRRGLRCDVRLEDGTEVKALISHVKAVK